MQGGGRIIVLTTLFRGKVFITYLPNNHQFYDNYCGSDLPIGSDYIAAFGLK